MKRAFGQTGCPLGSESGIVGRGSETIRSGLPRS
jgi:hypothetical protein